MSNLYSENLPERQLVKKAQSLTNNFAGAIARAELGRHWVSPAARDFVDVAPATSLAARKAAGFSDNDIDLAAAFEGALHELEAAA